MGHNHPIFCNRFFFIRTNKRGRYPTQFHVSCIPKRQEAFKTKKMESKTYISLFSLDDLKADDERMKEEFLPPRVAVLLPASFFS